MAGAGLAVFGLSFRAHPVLADPPAASKGASGLPNASRSKAGLIAAPPTETPAKPQTAKPALSQVVTPAAPQILPPVSPPTTSPDGSSAAPPSLPTSVAPPTSPFTPPAVPLIHAASAILVDAVSGQVLYERNADAPRPMASTTKIMTALLFCEYVREDAIITASPNACKTRESSLHLKPGERLSARDLLHAILMRSANDGCVAAAEHIAGSEAAFVALMNRRAGDLGATNTHFANPHGLNAPDHFTTARDLALIARAAMREPRIAEVTRTRAYRITRSKDKQDVNLRNHSHFLGHFPGADGVKTGWTVPAGHCYVGSATWNGWRLISVVLKSPDYVQETGALMNYGFHRYAPRLIAQAGEAAGFCPVGTGQKPTVAVRVKDPVQVVTPIGANAEVEQRIHLLPLTAPVQIGQTVGTLEACVGGKILCASPLVAAESDALATPVQQALGGSSWKRLAALAGIFAMGLVSLRYGTRTRIRTSALAKSARRFRRRLAKSLRGTNRCR